MTYSNKEQCQNCKYFIETKYPLGLCNHPNCPEGCEETTIRKKCDWFILENNNGR